MRLESSCSYLDHYVKGVLFEEEEGGRRRGKQGHYWGLPLCLGDNETWIECEVVCWGKGTFTVSIIGMTNTLMMWYEGFIPHRHTANMRYNYVQFT